MYSIVNRIAARVLLGRGERLEFRDHNWNLSIKNSSYNRISRAHNARSLIERNVPMRLTRALIKPAKFMFGDWISRLELISNKVYRLCRTTRNVAYIHT